jgi:hypothetical protein
VYGVSAFSDTLEFEVPRFAPARQFAQLLALVWATSVEDLEDSTLIVVELDSNPLSLSRALRLAQEWVRADGLSAIRFTVDGRSYVLEAADVQRPVDVPVA